MNDPNLGFIVAAYVVGFTTLIAMILAILYERASLTRALAKVARDSANESEP